MREPSAAEEYDLDGKYDLLLEPPQEPSRKPSLQWLAAFKKVTGYPTNIDYPFGCLII